jgi:hypothetical protein
LFRSETEGRIRAFLRGDSQNPRSRKDKFTGNACGSRSPLGAHRLGCNERKPSLLSLLSLLVALSVWFAGWAATTCNNDSNDGNDGLRLRGARAS